MQIEVLQEKFEQLKADSTYEEQLSADSIDELIYPAFKNLVLQELNVLFDDWKKDPSIEEIKKFFKASWKKMQEGLWPTYTAYPDSPLIEFLVDLGGYVAQELGEKTIKILMPELLCYYDNDCAAELLASDTQNPDLKEILRTHILDDKLKALIPVSNLIRDDLEEIDFEKHSLNLEDLDLERKNNLYYCLPHDKDHNKLTRAEQKRLLIHSLLTKTINEYLEKYHECKKYNSLFKVLNDLVAKLNRNDVHHEGTELQAGEEVYPALVRFDYFLRKFLQLPSNANEEEFEQAFNNNTKIPSQVRVVISHLLRKAEKHKNNNTNAGGTLSRCVAMEADNIEATIKENWEELSSICLDNKAPNESKTQIDTIIKQLSDCRKYCGKEITRITDPMLKALNISFPKLTLAECVTLIETQDVQIIKDLTKRDDVQETLKSLLSTQENLLNFLGDISTNKFQVIIKLKFIQEQIVSLINFDTDLGHLLDTICKNKLKILSSSFPDLIDKLLAFVFPETEKLNTSFRRLEVAQRITLFDLLENRFHEKINYAGTWIGFMKALPDERKEQAYEIFKKKICDSLERREVDFIEILMEIPYSKRKEFYRSYFPDEIILFLKFNRPNKLGELITYLPRSEQLCILAHIGKTWGESLVDFDFQKLIDSIPRDLHFDLYKACQTRLKNELNSSLSLTSSEKLIRSVPESAHEALCTVFEKEFLQTARRSADNLYPLLEALDKNARDKFLDTFIQGDNDKILALIKTGQDFQKIYQHASDYLRGFIYTQVPWNLIVHQARDFHHIIKCLQTDKEKNELYNIFENKWHEIIQNSSDFHKVFSVSSQKQRDTIYQHLSHYLGGSLADLIKTAQCLENILQFLTEEQRCVEYKNYKRLLGTTITTGADLCTALKYFVTSENLPLEKLLCGILDLRTIVRTVDDLINLLKGLDSEYPYRDALWALLDTLQLEEIVKETEQFYTVHNNLKNKNLKTEDFLRLCKRLKTTGKYLQLISKINYPNTLNQLFRTDSSLHADVLKAIEQNQSNIIKDTNHLGELLEDLNTEQCKSICDSFAKSTWNDLKINEHKIPPVVDEAIILEYCKNIFSGKPQKVVTAFSFLSQSNAYKLLDMLYDKEMWPDIVKTFDDLVTIAPAIEISGFEKFCNVFGEQSEWLKQFNSFDLKGKLEAISKLSKFSDHKEMLFKRYITQENCQGLIKSGIQLCQIYKTFKQSSFDKLTEFICLNLTKENDKTSLTISISSVPELINLIKILPHQYLDWALEISANLYEKLTPNNLEELLYPLNENYRRKVIKTLEEKNIWPAINNATDLGMILHYLPTDLIRQKLSARLLKSANDLKIVFRFLDKNQRMEVIKTLEEETWPEINNAPELAMILHYLPVNLIRERLSTALPQSAYDLKIILQDLSAEQREEIVRLLNDRQGAWPNVQDTNNLASLLYYLPIKYFTQFKNDIVRFSKTDLNNLLKLLDTESRNEVCKILEENNDWPEPPQSVSNLIHLLDLLPVEYWFSRDVKNYPKPETLDDVENLLACNQQGREKILTFLVKSGSLENFKSKWLHPKLDLLDALGMDAYELLMQNPYFDDFLKTNDLIHLTQRVFFRDKNRSLYARCILFLEKFLNSSSDKLSALLEILSFIAAGNHQPDAALRALLENTFSRTIRTRTDLLKFCKSKAAHFNLFTTQSEVLCKAVSPFLNTYPALYEFLTSDKFEQDDSHLNFESPFQQFRRLILEDLPLRQKILENLEESKEYQCLVDCLSDSRRSEALKSFLLNLFENHMHLLIRTCSDFNKISTKLSESEKDGFYQALQGKLPEIKTHYDLCQLLAGLTPNNQRSLINSIKERLPDLIKTKENFCEILEHTPLATQEVIFNALNPELFQLFIKHSVKDFTSILYHMQGPIKTLFYHCVKTCVFGLIDSKIPGSSEYDAFGPLPIETYLEAVASYRKNEHSEQQSGSLKRPNDTANTFFLKSANKRLHTDNEKLPISSITPT